MERSYETIAVDVTDRVAWVRFNRPERNNIIDATVVDEMFEALSELASRTDLQVVVLTGAGRTFSPGADLKRDPAQPARTPHPRSYQAAQLLAEMPHITVAAINGACAGAGLAYAIACDLRVASATAKMAVGFLDVGVSGELGLTWMLTRSLGTTRAREILLLPRKFTAADAQQIGLVSQVYGADIFEHSVTKLVAELAGRDTGALRDIKRNLVDADALSLADYLPRETERHVSRFTGDGAAATLARLIDRGRTISSDV